MRIHEQVEVFSLMAARPTIHAHVVIGKSDGTVHGSHLLEAHVWPTLEVVLTEAPKHLRRQVDAETGLALIGLGESQQVMRPPQSNKARLQ